MQNNSPAYQIRIIMDCSDLSIVQILRKYTISTQILMVKKC